MRAAVEHTKRPQRDEAEEAHLAHIAAQLAAAQADLERSERARQALLESRSYRLGAALRDAGQGAAALVAAITSRLRHPSARYSFEPLADVRVAGVGAYEATGADPQLRLGSPTARYPAGWVFLHVEVATTPAYPFALQLFFDTGAGFNEAQSLRLPRPEDGVVAAFVRLPRGVRGLRLDVGEQRGVFGVSSVRVAPLWGVEAWSAHLARRALGLPSWHPRHAVDTWRQQSPSLLDGLRRLLTPEAGPRRVAQTRVAPERQANLALYASADNVARAGEAQQARSARAVTVAKRGLSVVILNLNKPELIIPLVDNLLSQRQAFVDAGVTLDILIGDTGSTDRQVLDYYAAQEPNVRVVRDLRYHFSRCNNAVAFTHATTDTLLFLNNDIIFPPDSDALWRMYTLLDSEPRTGVVGCPLYFPDGRVQHIGIDFFREAAIRGLCFHPRAHEQIDRRSLAKVWRVPAVTGACLMIKSELFGALGGMDEDYAAECQDVALCLHAAQLGRDTRIVEAGPVQHLENATRRKGEENWPDRQRFLRRFGAYIEARFLE